MREDVPMVHVTLTSQQAQLVIDALTYEVEDARARLAKERADFRYEVEKYASDRMELERKIQALEAKVAGK